MSAARTLGNFILLAKIKVITIEHEDKMHTCVLYCSTALHYGNLSTYTNPLQRVLICLSFYIHFYLQIAQGGHSNRQVFKILLTAVFDVTPAVIKSLRDVSRLDS